MLTRRADSCINHLNDCLWGELKCGDVCWGSLEAVTQSFPFTPSLCDIILAVISGQSHPPMRPSVLRANRVLTLTVSLSLFGQQSFLKNVFFSEKFCFCFVLYGCPPCTRGSVVDHSDTLTTWAFLIFFFFFFTFCKLRGEKTNKRWTL